MNDRLQEFAIPRSKLNELYSAFDYNRTDLVSLYSRLLNDTGNDFSLERKLDRVANCHNVWECNHYNFHHIKIVKRINLCHDRFCPNCQGLLARTREEKFRPHLDNLAQDHDLYHVVFTQPNVQDFDLKSNVKDIFNSFGKLIRYFRGNAKVKGLALKQYGYVAAVRSLEITREDITKKSRGYHPHIHCIFALKKGLVMPKTNINDYSYDNKNGKKTLVRYFSDFEILLQKMWYLLMNNMEMTLENLNDLDIGYSSYAERINDGQYSEVFKYAVKVNYSEMSSDIEVFKTLHDVLHNRRVIQGYGLLFGIVKDDKIDSAESDALNSFEAELQTLEKPISCVQTFDEIMDETALNPKLLILTRQRIYHAWRECGGELSQQATTIKQKLEYEQKEREKSRERLRKMQAERKEADRKRGEAAIKIGFIKQSKWIS